MLTLNLSDVRGVQESVQSDGASFETSFALSDETGSKTGPEREAKGHGYNSDDSVSGQKGHLSTHSWTLLQPHWRITYYTNVIVFFLKQLFRKSLYN